MKTAWMSGFGVFLALGFLFFGGAAYWSSPVQPIRFNHAIHVANGMDCADCHPGARTGENATLPGIDVCLSCHGEALTKSPEEEKIRTIAKAGKEIPWVQLTRVPRHVYFSHRRHAGLGGIPCTECHGPMEKRTAPPPEPFRTLNMNACIQCHQQRNVRHDCDDCHR